MPAHLEPEALRLLKSLERNNDRDWFNERKEKFTNKVQEPWLAVIEEVNTAMAEFAPEYVQPAKKVAMRIYRDIRFSADKRPYKTHLAAWWSGTGTERTSGGGFYVQAGPKGVMIAGGVYMPLREQLLAIRRYLQENHDEFRRLVQDNKRRKLLPDLDTNPLTRVPKGFPAGDPAEDLILCRQWALRAELPAEVATTEKLVSEIVSRFRALLPVVSMLNTPLVSKASRKSLF